MTALSVLREWRLEGVWFAVAVTLALWLATPARVKADRQMYYDPLTNWCYLLQPLDCLWQDPPPTGG